MTNIQAMGVTIQGVCLDAGRATLSSLSFCSRWPAAAEVWPNLVYDDELRKAAW